MNIKSIKRIIISSILILTMSLVSVGYSFAANSSDLTRQKNELDKQINEKKEELDNVKEELSTTMSQISKLNQEIENYESEISTLNAQITSLDAQIVEKETNLQEQQAKFDQQKEALEKRLIVMYESGSMTYLDILLSSNGVIDFISNYYLISEIAKADEELLNSIEETKNLIQAEKESIEVSRTERVAVKADVENKKSALDVSKSQKNALAGQLTEEEKEIQAELDAFLEDKLAIEKRLAADAAKEGIVPVNPSEAGYIMPLAGKSKANITTGYGHYETRSGRHTGIDFACPAGTPIYCVKDGTVDTSTALTYSNGRYRSYGEYIIINHHDGTYTLYGHMLPGSRLVSPGEKVSQGQQIGQVGSTGNSTGNHLHFEVRVKGKDVNPIPYLP